MLHFYEEKEFAQWILAPQPLGVIIYSMKVRLLKVEHLNEGEFLYHSVLVCFVSFSHIHFAQLFQYLARLLNES